MHPSSHKISNPGGQNEVAILRGLIEQGKNIIALLRSGQWIEGKVAWSDIHNIALSNIALSGAGGVSDVRAVADMNIVIPKGSIEFWAYEV